MKERPILYTKPGCPWCAQALTFFNQHGVDILIKDVNRDLAAMKRMVDVSGQTLTPTFEFGEFVVADFSVDEFLAELEEVPEIRFALGLGQEED